MSRSFFYKAALILALSSLIPFIIFLSRRENPPEKISVKLHQKQTVENFVLTSSGKSRWILKSPLAVFREKELIELDSPVLTVSGSPPIVVRARKALFDRKRGELELEGVEMETGELSAASPQGVYFVERELFKTDKGCLVKSGSATTTGKECTLKLDKRKVIITQQVKTVITGEGK
ncbi:LPS export ABC transporter periplasmic protein LptC [Thermovibrio sp.]